MPIVLAAMALLVILPSLCLGASLVERLGFAPDDRALIINCDDVGMCHAQNQASFDALTQGVATSATVMMTCPWVSEVVAWKRDHPGADLGVHLTLTSEWDEYRWRPLLGVAAPSLVDPAGYLWKDDGPLWEHADADEAHRECRAQVEMAVRHGLEPTHIDNHMGSLQLNPGLAAIYVRLGEEFNLPLRLASAEAYAAFGVPGHRKVYDDLGILGPDELVYEGNLPAPPPEDPADVPAFYAKVLEALRPGKVTELILHAAKDGPELASITGSHRRRQADYQWACADSTRKLMADLGIRLVGYRALRDLQRGELGSRR